APARRSASLPQARQRRSTHAPADNRPLPCYNKTIPHESEACPMKLGIIRCMQTEDYCPGTTDFRLLAAHEGAFQNISEPIELIGFTSCGGCPGKRAPLRARLLVERGADAIAFASCIGKGTPIGYPCPFFRKML